MKNQQIKNLSTDLDLYSPHTLQYCECPAGGVVVWAVSCSKVRYI